MSALTPLLPSGPGGLVLFDVDLTLTSGASADMPEFEVRSGAVETIRDLVTAGYRVGLWTAGGLTHAVTVADRLGVADLLACAIGKPGCPMEPEAVVAAVGELPVLTVDDDWGEAVPGVPFARVSAFWGRRISAAEAAAYEASVGR